MEPGLIPWPQSLSGSLCGSHTSRKRQIIVVPPGFSQVEVSVLESDKREMCL